MDVKLSVEERSPDTPVASKAVAAPSMAPTLRAEAPTRRPSGANLGAPSKLGTVLSLSFLDMLGTQEHSYFPFK